MPRSAKAFAAAIPLEPAPITQTLPPAIGRSPHPWSTNDYQSGDAGDTGRCCAPGSRSSARLDLDLLGLRLGLRPLGQGEGQHPVPHAGLDLLRVDVLGQAER